MHSPRLFILCIALLCNTALAAEKKPFKLDLSRETTYVTGPLRPDGFVDYVQAYDDICSREVTADNNAGPLLLRAFGPALYFEDEQFKRVCNKLKIPTHATAEDYFISFHAIIKIAWNAGDEDHEFSPRDLRVARLLPQGAAAGYRKKYREDFIFTAEMMNKLPLPPGPWKAEEYPLYDVWLRANTKPLELIKQAADKSHFFLPSCHETAKVRMLERTLPNLGLCRDAARLLLTRAMLRAKQGDAQGAWDDILSVYRLSRLLAQQPSIITGLIAVSLETLAHDSAQRLAVEGGLTSEQLNRCRVQLSAMKPRSSIQQALDIDERFMALDSIGMLRESVLSRKLPEPVRIFVDNAVDWNFVLREMNKWCDGYPRFEGARTAAQRLELVSAMNDRGKAHQKAFRARLEPTEEEKAKFNLNDQLAVIQWFAVRTMSLPPDQWQGSMSKDLADWMIGILSPGLGNSVQFSEIVQSKMVLTQITFALMAYRTDKGQFPARLIDLVPHHLLDVPADHFTLKPLIYQPRGNSFLLYSLGTNQKDDGGVNITKEESYHADIAVRVEEGRWMEPK